MTTPGGDGELIARGYIRIELDDRTRGEMERLLARLRAQARRGVTIPVRLDEAGARRELRDVTARLRDVSRNRPVSLMVRFSRTQAQAALREALTGVTGTVTARVRFLRSQARTALNDALRGLTGTATGNVLFPVGQAREALRDTLNEVSRRPMRVRITPEWTMPSSFMPPVPTPGAAPRMPGVTGPRRAEAEHALAAAKDAVQKASTRLAAALRVETILSREVAAAKDRLHALNNAAVQNLGEQRRALAELNFLQNAHRRAVDNLRDARRAEQAATWGQAEAAWQMERAMLAETVAASRLVGGIDRIGRAWNRLPGRPFLPWKADLIEASGPAMQRLLDRLHELRQAAVIRPKYEARIVYDEMGRAHVRYFKLSSDAGTFMGEIMSRNMVRSFVRGIRVPALFGPILTGAAAVASSAALLAIPTMFNAIAIAAQKSNADVTAAMVQLRRNVTESLRSLTAQVVPSFQRSIQILGLTFAGLEPQLRDVFRHLGPQVEVLTMGIARFANQAMPGLTAAVRASSVVIHGFGDGLESIGRGVTAFFRNLSTAAPEASQTMRTFGRIAEDVLSAVGVLGAEITKVFGGQIWNEAEAIFHRLAGIVMDFARGALPALGTGLEAAMNVFSAILRVIEPFAGIMGTWVGTILGVTIAIRGVSSAFGVMAAAMNALRFTPITTALNILATQLGNAGLAASMWTTRMTGSAAAGEKVASTSNRVVGVLGRLGGAIPVVGVALTALAIAFEESGRKAEESIVKILDGTRSVSEAVAEEEKIIRMAMATRMSDVESYHAWAQGKEQTIPLFDEAAQRQLAEEQATRKVTAAIEEHLAALSPLEQAKARVAMAERAYNDAVKEHGPASDQATKAAEKLADASQRLGAEQDKAKKATQSHTAALVEQGNQMRGMVDAGFAYEEAVRATAEAQKEAEKALRSGGRATDEYKEKVRELAEAMHDQAGAAQRRAEEAYAHLGPQAAAQAGEEAYRNEILRTAAASGIGRDALIELTRHMNQAGLDAISAKAKLSGLRTEVVTLPDGRKVMVIAEADRDKFDQFIRDKEAAEKTGAVIPIEGNPLPFTQALALVLSQINAGHAEVDIDGRAVNANSALAEFLAHANSSIAVVKIDGNEIPTRDALIRVVDQINSSNGTVAINGNEMPAADALAAVVAAIDSGAGTVDINGNKVPAESALQVLLGLIGSSSGTVNINGRDVPAAAVLLAFLTRVNNSEATSTTLTDIDPAMEDVLRLLGFTDASVGTTTTDTNPQPALDKIAGAKATADSTIGTMGVNAKTGNATSAISRLRDFATAPATMVVNVIRRIFGAEGGVFTPMAEGGLLGFARGGAAMTARDPNGVARDLTPMSGAHATVVPPNTWRVIGDNMRHPELFAPLDGSQRSLELLQTGAAAFNHTLVPVKAASAPTYNPPASAAAAPAAAGGDGSAVVIHGGVHVTLEGKWDLSNPTLPRQLVVNLEEALRDLGRERR